MSNRYKYRPSGQWLKFTDRWRVVDEGQLVADVAKAFERQVALLEARAGESGEASYRAQAAAYRKFLQAWRIRNMLFLMESVLRDDREWDNYPHYWPASQGIVDLSTGNFGHHQEHRLISKYSDVTFDAGARATRWTQFLREIQQNDTEMIEYLQRCVGYTMTGLINEQVLFILYGSGANGKNIFLEVLYELFGALGHQTNFRVLERHSGNDAAAGSASPHIAVFKNKRFIMASESIEGSSFNDGLVKSLTGDGQITARDLFQSESVFRNTGKFWLACNNMPRVHDVTPGFWRRLHIIPFLASFNGDQRDLFLKEKLLSELPGILNWSLEGAQQWYSVGLRPPHAVANAVAHYRGVSDPIGAFLEDNCSQHNGVHTSKTGLYAAYREYAKGDVTGKPLSRDRFYAIVRNHGFEESRIDDKRVFRGVCLRRDLPNFAVTREEVAAAAGGA